MIRAAVIGLGTWAWQQRRQPTEVQTLQEVVQRQYDLNRREGALQSFLKAAFNRVVEPLQRRKDPQLPPRPGPRGEAGGEDRGRRGR